MRKTAQILIISSLFALCIFLTFSYVIFAESGTISGQYDVYKYFIPWTFFIDHVIHSGEFPFWNPLVFCGMPAAANPQSFAFYPPNLIRSLLTINPTPGRSATSFTIMMGLHLLLIAVSTYFLGRNHKLSHGGSIVSGIAFSFSCIMIMRMCDCIFVFTMAWLPLTLVLVKKTIDSKGVTRFFYAFLAGLTLGLSILGGFVQIINLQGLFIAFYALLYFLINTNWDDYKTFYQNLLLWVTNGLAMVVIILIALGLAAVVLLPAWELGEFTVRAGGTSVSKLSNLWAWSPLTFYQSMVVYPGIEVVGESIRNSGIIALLLSFLSLTHSRRREVFMFLVIYFIFIECSFGPPLPIGSLLEKLTPFALSSYTRAYDFGLLALSMLAGYGFDAILRPMRTRGSSYCRAVILILAAMLCLMPLYKWTLEIDFMRVPVFAILFPILAIFIILATGLFRFRKCWRNMGAVMLVLILFGEILSWNIFFVPYLTTKRFQDITEFSEEDLSIPTTNNRITDPISNRLLFSLQFAMNGIDPMHIGAVRDILSGPPRDKMQKRLIRNWEPTRENLRGNMLFKRSFWLARQYALGKLPGKREYFPSATTVFLENEIDSPIPLIERQNLEKSSISDDCQETKITEPTALFKQIPPSQKSTLKFSALLPINVSGRPIGPAGAIHSTLVYSYVSTTDATINIAFTEDGTGHSEMGISNSIHAIGNKEVEFEVPLPDFSGFTATIYVVNSGKGSFQFTDFTIKSDLCDEDGLIKILARTANTVDLQVGPCKDYRILTFLDTFYPGWYAFVDGKPVSILRANEQFKAITLSPGTHRVYFEFRPQTVLYAYSISIFTFFGALVIVLLLWMFRLYNFYEYRQNNIVVIPNDGQNSES